MSYNIGMQIQFFPEWIKEEEKEILFPFVNATYQQFHQSDVKHRLHILNQAFQDIFVLLYLIKPDYSYSDIENCLSQKLLNFIKDKLSDKKENLCGEPFDLEDIVFPLTHSHFKNFDQLLQANTFPKRSNKYIQSLLSWIKDNPFSFFFLTIRSQPTLCKHIAASHVYLHTFNFSFTTQHKGILPANNQIVDPKEPFITLLPAFDYYHINYKKVTVPSYTQLTLPYKFMGEEIEQIFGKQYIYDEQNRKIMFTFPHQFSVNYSFLQKPTFAYLWDVFMSEYFPSHKHVNSDFKQQITPYLIDWLIYSRSITLSSQRICMKGKKTGTSLQFYVAEQNERQIIDLLGKFQICEKEPEISQYSSWGKIYPSIVYQVKDEDWQINYTPYNCNQQWFENKWIADSEKIFTNILKYRLSCYHQIQLQDIWVERQISVNGYYDIRFSYKPGYDNLSELLSSYKSEEIFFRLQFSLAQRGLVLSPERKVFQVKDTELSQALVRYCAASPKIKEKRIIHHDSDIAGVEQMYYANTSNYYYFYRILKKHGLIKDNDFDYVNIEHKGQSAIQSEKGRFQLIGWNKNNQEVLSKASQLHLLKKQKLSDDVILRSPDEKQVFVIAKSMLKNPEHLFLPGGKQVVHGITAGSLNTPEVSLDSFKQIVEQGGLLSIRERRHKYICHQTSSPMGDILSNIDHGIPSAITDQPFYGDNIFIIISPAILFHKHIWFAPYDYGGGKSRGDQYHKYAQSLGQENINVSPSLKARKKHLRNIVDKDNEVFVRGGISCYLFRAVFVRDIIFKQTKQFIEQHVMLKTFPDIPIIRFETTTSRFSQSGFSNQFLNYVLEEKYYHPLHDLDKWKRI